MNLNASMSNVDAASLGYDTCLVFIGENWFGAKISGNHFNRIAVKIEDIPTLTEAKVLVRSQGDQYMSVMGTRYLLTPEFESMDADGKLHFLPHVRTFSEPVYSMLPRSAGLDSPSMARAPTAPPTGAHRNNHHEEKRKEVIFSFPISIDEVELYDMHVRKIENDSEFVALYTTQKGTVFKTMMAYRFPYLNEQTLHVYGVEGATSLDIRDAWGNKYYRVDGEALQVFTRREIPIFPPNPYTHTVDPRPSAATVGPKDSRYHAPTPRYARNLVPAYDKPYGSSDPRFREPSGIPRLEESLHEDKAKSGRGEIGVGTSSKDPNVPRGKGKFPEPRIRGKREELGAKNIRPTTLQKFCKTFDRTRDRMSM